jgi:RNA recognition motif-containing protein
MLSTTEQQIREAFEQCLSISDTTATIERVKKIKDYAFVHFSDRRHAIDAMKRMNSNNVCNISYISISDEKIDGARVEVVLAKPPDRSIMRYVKNAHKLAATTNQHQHHIADASTSNTTTASPVHYPAQMLSPVVANGNRK